MKLTPVDDKKIEIVMKLLRNEHTYKLKRFLQKKFQESEDMREKRERE